MLELRLVKIVMASSLALFALLVAFNNVADYGSNYAFVQHVLSMDTTFPNNSLRWRAITDPALWQGAYWLIIASEALTGLVYAIGALAMLGQLHTRADAFNRAKRFVYVGTALGFLLWFVGFMVVGGEWFSMWQSPTWNGQEAAFRFYITILGVGVFIALEDR